MYLKLILGACIIALSFAVSVKAALKYKKEADILRFIAQEFLLFKDGIILQNRSIKEMSGAVTSQNPSVKEFFSNIYGIISRNPEIPLNEVLCNAVDVLCVSEASRDFIKHEMCFISSLFNQHIADIFVEGINNSCNRLILESDKIMDKYRKNLFLYKRMGVLLGIIICMFIF